MWLRRFDCASSIASWAFSPRVLLTMHEYLRQPPCRCGALIRAAHECAKVCRTKFYVVQARALFLEHFTIRDRHDREELKLVLALLMQREGHETGDPNGWNENVAKRLVNAEFEDEEKGFESFVECVRAQVGVEESAGEREVLAKALETLRFVERGP